MSVNVERPSNNLINNFSNSINNIRNYLSCSYKIKNNNDKKLNLEVLLYFIDAYVESNYDYKVLVNDIKKLLEKSNIKSINDIDLNHLISLKEKTKNYNLFLYVLVNLGFFKSYNDLFEKLSVHFNSNQSKFNFLLETSNYYFLYNSDLVNEKELMLKDFLCCDDISEESMRTFINNTSFYLLYSDMDRYALKTNNEKKILYNNIKKYKIEMSIYLFKSLVDSIDDLELKLDLIYDYFTTFTNVSYYDETIEDYIKDIFPKNEKELDLYIKIMSLMKNIYFKRTFYTIDDRLKTSYIIKVLKICEERNQKLYLRGFTEDTEFIKEVFSNADITEKFEIFKYMVKLNSDEYFLGNLITEFFKSLDEDNFEIKSIEDVSILSQCFNIITENPELFSKYRSFYVSLFYRINDKIKIDNIDELKTKEFEDSLFSLMSNYVDYSLRYEYSDYSFVGMTTEALKLFSSNDYILKLLENAKNSVINKYINSKDDEKEVNELRNRDMVYFCTYILENYSFNSEEDVDIFIRTIDSFKEYQIFDSKFKKYYYDSSPLLSSLCMKLLEKIDNEEYKDKIIKYFIGNAPQKNLLDYLNLIMYYDNFDKVIESIRNLYDLKPELFSNENDELSETITKIFTEFFKKTSSESNLRNIFTLFDLNDEFKDHNIILDYNSIIINILDAETQPFSYDFTIDLANKYYSYFLENVLKPNNTSNAGKFMFASIPDFASKLSTFEDKYRFFESITTNFNFKNTGYYFSNNPYDGTIGLENRIISTDIFDLTTGVDDLVNQITMYINNEELNNFINITEIINTYIMLNDNFDHVYFLDKLLEVGNLPKYSYNSILSKYITSKKSMDVLLHFRDYLISTGSYVTILRNLYGSRDALLNLKPEEISMLFPIEYFSNGYTISELFIDESELYETWQKSFPNEELQYYNEGRIGALLKKYTSLGPISDKALQYIYNKLSKYFKNYDDFISKISSNPVFKSIFEQSYYSPAEFYSSSDSYIDKLILIYPATRYKEMLNVTTLGLLTPDLCEKFDLKFWKKLKENPLFSTTTNTDKALIELIKFAGLFEKDPEVELRRRKILELLNINNNLYNLSEIEPYDKDNFIKQEVIEYTLRDGVDVPANISGYIERKLSSKDMKRLLDYTGTLGSSINKFLYPYSHEGDIWTLKREVDIDQYPELKPVMTNEEMSNILNDPNTRIEVLCFLQPYVKDKKTMYKFNPKMNNRIYVSQLLRTNYSTLNLDSISRVFNKLGKYDPKFFEFFLKNYDLIMKDSNSQAAFRLVLEKYDEIKSYYFRRGNVDPTYTDFLTYLTSNDLTYKYGNKEFANAYRLSNKKYTQSGYDFYERILAETKQRRKTTVPRHNKRYEIVTPSGRKYTLVTRMLRADDYMNLLIGEVEYTNCCQCFSNAGQSCMEHASKSQSGSIFATYLIEDGEEKLVTQSWTWTNESKLCFDNIETAGRLKSGDDIEDLRYAVSEVYKLAAQDIIESSELKVEEYYKKERDRISKLPISDEEKAEMLTELEEVRERQKIKTVTVGTFYDVHFHAGDLFTSPENDELSVRPKDYKESAYSDARLGYQRIVAQKEGAKPINPKFKEVPIYRDERQIISESGIKIKQSTLKKISDIEKFAHKKEMVQYSKEDDYILEEPSDLANIYSCSVISLRVIYGEDWYYVYSVTKDKIEVFDLAKGEPRIEDEAMNQVTEMSSAFNTILKEAFIFDENGKVIGVREISASLREDTSYPLFLAQIRRGIIEQVGDDIVFPYENESDKRVVDKEEQKATLSKMKQIKKEGNPNMYMHNVTFKPTEEAYRRLFADKVIEGREL